MATTIARSVLLDKLGIIAGTIRPDSNTPEDSSNILVIQDGALVCIANQFMVRIPAGLDLDEPVNIEFRLLYDYLRKSKAKEVTIGLTPNGTLGLKAGKAKVEFAVSNQYMYDLSTIASVEWKPLPENFVTAMGFTAWAADVTDAAVSHVAIKDGVMWGYNLKDKVSCYNMKTDKFADGVTYVHADALNFCSRYLGFDAAKPPTYAISGGWLHLKNADDVIFSSRTRADSNVDTEFLNDLVTADDFVQFRLNVEFAEMLERSNPFSGKDVKNKRVTVHIDNVIHTKKGDVTAPKDMSWVALTASREDGSRVFEQSMIRRVDKPVHFTVSYGLFSDMLKHGETFQLCDGKLVAIGSTDNGRPDGEPMYRSMVTLSAE